MRRYINYIIIAVIFALIYGFCFDVKLDINGDNASYIKLAENMANGLGYSNIGINGVEPASHFPPGYPAILAFFISMGINNLIFFKILNGVFLLVSLLMLYYIVNNISGNRALAAVIAVLTIFSPKLLDFASMAMSEMSYLFCIVLVVFALFKYCQDETKSSLRSPYLYLAIIAAAGSYYIRTVGMSIIFAMFIFFLFRREWKSLFVSIAGVVLLLLPWAIRNASYGIESRYFGTIMTVNPWRPEEGSISSVGEMIEKMITNFDETIIKGAKYLLFPFVGVDYGESSGLFLWIVGLAVLALIFYGAWNMGKLRYLLLAFIAANIGLFMLWHGGNGSRYVVPIAPILFVCFWSGVFGLRRFIGSYRMSYDNKVPYLFLLMLVPMFFPVKERVEESSMPYPPAFNNYFAIAKSIHQEEGTKGKVVCCRKPELLSYYAKDVIAVNYAYTLDSDELIRDLIAKRVDYVLLDNLGFSSTPRYLFPAIDKNIDLFQPALVFKEPETYLFIFDRDKAKGRFR